MQSSEVITPLAIQTPIAVNGDKNIPSQSASGTDTSSINLGFLPITSEPLDDGGVAPERIDFNGMFYLSTDQRVFLQNGGIITYDSSVATKIGGYPKGAILGYVDANDNYGFVASLVENNQYNFVITPSYIDGEKWVWVSLKADLSNMNPTQTVKNTIIGWGMPDWSRAITKVKNTTYTADSKGWVQSKGATAGSGVGLKINGIWVAYAEANGSQDTGGYACLVPVDVGDTFIASGSEVRFIPCKGEQ